MTTPVTHPAEQTVDSQGSTLEFCATGVGTPDTLLPGVGVIPQINSGKQWEDDTDVGASNRTYFEKSLPEDQDFELVLRHTPADTAQKSFTDMVKSSQRISVKVTRASGEVQDFEFLPQDYFSGESGKESGKQMFGCIGKLQNITFSTLSPEAV